MPDVVTTQNVDWPELADKMLDLGTKAASSLSDKIQEIAPQAWEIAIKQAYANAIGDVICSFLITVSLFVFMFLLRKYWPPAKRDTREYPYAHNGEWYSRLVFSSIIPCVGIVASLIVFVVNFTYAIKVFINPEYYAIKIIFDLI